MDNNLNTLNASLKASEIISSVKIDVKDVLRLGKLSESKLAIMFAVSQQAIDQWKRGICRPATYNLLKLHHLAEDLRSKS